MSARKRMFLAAVGWLATTLTASAQAPAARKVFTNKPLFTVPLKMEDGDRAKITGLKCYVKTPGGSWTLHDAGTAQTAKFTYQAVTDGEYAFSFATIDSAGRENPARPDLDGPKLVVVVDTQGPEFAANAVSVASGQSYVQVNMRDANPDPSTLTAEAEQPDGSFIPLVPHDKDTPGFFRIPGATPTRVRVGGKDKAGNPTVSIVSLSQPTPTEVAAQPAVNGAPTMLPPPTSPSPVIVPPSVKSNNLPAANTPPANLAIQSAAPIQAPVKAPETIFPKPIEEPQLPKPVVPKQPDLVLPKPVLPDPALPRVAEKPIEPPVNSGEQIVASPKVSLNYAVDGLAATAIHKVEAYAVHEDGRRWMKIGEDADRISPIELTLPGEGKWGITLVVSTANRPSPPPGPGDQPDWWVEVDSTPPIVTIENVAVGTGDESNLLLLQWTVRDKNAKPDSVDAFWSHSAEGPWQPIARGLRADGQYKWPIPREAGAKAFVKVETQDRAGNVGRAITSQPVALETARPRVRVLGINPAAVRQ